MSEVSTPRVVRAVSSTRMRASARNIAWLITLAFAHVGCSNSSEDSWEGRYVAAGRIITGVGSVDRSDPTQAIITVELPEDQPEDEEKVYFLTVEEDNFTPCRLYATEGGAVLPVFGCEYLFEGESYLMLPVSGVFTVEEGELRLVVSGTLGVSLSDEVGAVALDYTGTRE